MKQIKGIIFTCLSILCLGWCLTIYADKSTATKTSKNHGPTAHENSTALDHIVAVVNDDVVTLTELNHAVAIAKMQMEQAQVPNPPPANELQQRLLDQLIDKKLQLQMAKQANITIGDDEVDQAIAKIAKQNNVSINELYEHVKQEGLSKEEYRSELQNQLTLQKLQQQEVASHITITPDEVKRFAKNKVWQQDIPVEKEYQIEDILVPLPDDANDQDIADAKKHAYVLFAELKSRRSVKLDDGKVNVTDLGFRRVTQLPSAFANEVPHLKPNGVAGPIQTGNGFHIIRLAAERALGGKKPEQPTQKQLEQLLFQHKYEEAVQNWLSKLRSQAFIITNPES